MGRPNIGLLRVDTVYSEVEKLGIPSFYVPLISLTAIVVVCKLLLDLFLSTGHGLAMRAAGANPRMAQANGVRVHVMIVIGLAIANGLTALSGALFAQMMGAADVSMGIGVIVVALAAVIGGTAIIPSRVVVISTFACVIGSILYRLAIAVALDTGWSGLTASDVNVVTAFLVAVALFLPGRNFSLRKSARGAAQ